jgi:hypothetical protein
LSFPRKRESSKFKEFWTPAFAGVTVFGPFTISSITEIPNLEWNRSGHLAMGDWNSCLPAGRCLGFEILDLEF